jgi:hypothetical protein
MGLAERVAAGHKRHGFLVVHRHPREGVADMCGRLERIGLPFTPSGLT